MRDLDLTLGEVSDEKVRENLQRIQDVLIRNPFMKFDGKHFSFSFTANGTNRLIPHGLSFKPRDVLVTASYGTGTITWNYADFDRTNIDITLAGTSSTDPLVVRAFIGNYSEI